MPQVTVAQLFEDNREALKLSWLAGEGAQPRRCSTAGTSTESRRA